MLPNDHGGDICDILLLSIRLTAMGVVVSATSGNKALDFRRVVVVCSLSGVVAS